MSCPMKQLLTFCVLVVIAASCQCGPGPGLCDATKCGTGLICAPATGKCVSTTEDGGATGGGSGGGGGGTLGDGGTDAGVCPTACAGATPICDVAGQRCVGCVTANDCTAVTPFCLPSASICVECRNLLDCPNARDCDMTSHTCLPDPDAGTGGGGGANDPVVYGHTATTLFKVNATTKVVTAVADFNNCDSDVIDLALDQYSRAFVTTQSGLYRLNLVTAGCTNVNTSNTETYPNSLPKRSTELGRP